MFRSASAGLPHPPHQQPHQHGLPGHLRAAPAPESEAGAQPAAVRLQTELDPGPRDPGSPGQVQQPRQSGWEEDRGAEEVSAGVRRW